MENSEENDEIASDSNDTSTDSTNAVLTGISQGSVVNENMKKNILSDDKVNNTNNCNENENKGNSDQNNDKHELEHYRLAGRKPLITVLIMSVGPILSQITAALYGVVATIWVSKSIGEKGMTAISTYTAFDNIARSFGFFVSVAGSTSISGLFGAGKEEEAGQVICDLLRVCLFFGIVVPGILCPTIKMGVSWFGASNEIVELGYEYMLPMLVCSATTCIYIGSGGFLQGEGKSMLYGAVTIVSSILNMVLLCPLFLLVFKTGICGAGIATALAEAIPGLGLCILFFCGKFAVKPKFGQLFKKFSPHTLPSLKVGLSQLIANLSVSVPGIIIRKLIGASSSDETSFNDSLAGFNVIFRYAQITNSVIVALTMGFLPAASYAYSAKMYRRWLKLAIHCNWMGFAWGTLTSIISWSIPREVSLIFSNGEGYLKWATPMLRVGNALGFIVFGRFTVPAMLQSLKMGTTSSVLSLSSQLVSIIAFALILFYTNKHDAVRLLWCYPLSYAFGLVAGAIVLSCPIIRIVKGSKADEADIRPTTLAAHKALDEKNAGNEDHEEVDELEEL